MLPPSPWQLQDMITMSNTSDSSQQEQYNICIDIICVLKVGRLVSICLDVFKKILQMASYLYAKYKSLR